MLQSKKTLQLPAVIENRNELRVYAYRSEYFKLCTGRLCHYAGLAAGDAGQYCAYFTLPLTRSCWEITKLSLFPYGNEAIHVDELNPAAKSVLMNTGGTLLNIFWLLFFGWWLCLMHIASGIAQCVTIIGIPVGIANFKIAAIALWPVGRRVVSVETARAAREANARRRFE